jgi:heptosyltransferase-1
MPALTDARRLLPRARFAWAVEEAFVPLVRQHPAVSEVIPVASRRWRRSLWRPKTIKDIAASVTGLRARRFDEVVDTQGLLRSALLTRLARGRWHGYARGSIREPLASAFYDVRHPVSRKLHAIDRNRILTGLALGYTPDGPPDFGLERGRFRDEGERTAVLLHATARPEKEWPEDNWIVLGRWLGGQGILPVLPWGTEAERARAERIAGALVRARVPERQPLDKVARMIAGADLVVGVDTGLLHLAAAFGVPLVAIFCGSRPQLTAPVGSGPMCVLGEFGAAPSVEQVEAAAEQLLG